eukprot:5370213-Pyramimonas_sp.AAC.1
MPSDSVNVNSKEFISWLGEHHDNRPAWADRRCTTVPFSDNVDIHGMEPEAGSHMEALPTDGAREKVIAAIEIGATMLFTAQTREKAAPRVDATNVSAAAAATSDVQALPASLCGIQSSR